MKNDFVMPADPRTVRRQVRPLRKRAIRLERDPDGRATADVPFRWRLGSPPGTAMVPGGGFDWGYRGSGPQTLALNILGEFVPPPEAWRLHRAFMHDVVATLPRLDDGKYTSMEIPASLIRRWLRDQWAEDRRREKGQEST